MEKRKLIMMHAFDLFAEQGFHATSVQEITERSGISKGAFYLSFKSKDELIVNLIHYFLQKFLADIDQLVNESTPDKLLLKFYEHHFGLFLKQSGVAKIFMKEQAHFLDEELMKQISGYNELLQDSILTMLEKVYGEEVREKKYDLVYTILGLMKSYMEFLLYSNLPFDPLQIAKSLVEKTDILVRHMKQPVVTERVYALIKEPRDPVITEEKTINAVDETIALLDESVEKESLLLLKEEMNEPSLGMVVVMGLLKNIEAHPECKRASFLLHYYFEL